MRESGDLRWRLFLRAAFCCFAVISATLTPAFGARPEPYKWSQFVQTDGQPEPVPVEWVSTPEGKFAHSIKLPNPVPKSSGYRSSMNTEEYFQHLCKTEAGEFVFKKTSGVQGLLQIRPHDRPTDALLKSRFALEHPEAALYFWGGSPETLLVGTTRYAFFETPPSDWHKKKYHLDDHLIHFSGYNEFQNKGMVVASIEKPTAQYGFIWRGLIRPHAREHGIAGGEILVIDLSTREILGLRRAYLRSGRVRNAPEGIWWPTGQVCANLLKDRLPPPHVELVNFLTSIARPARYEQKK